MPKAKRPTQADVARLAGVSQTTVSMVLNQRDGGAILLSQGTIDKVYSAMESLGYAPDPVAQMLAAGQNQLLALFSYDDDANYGHEGFYLNILAGIEMAANQHDYNILLMTAHGSATERKIFRRGVNTLALAAGAILLGTFPDYDELRRLVALDYPFVFVGRRHLPGSELNWVVSDYTSASIQATQHLIDLNHRQLGYLTMHDRLRTIATEERVAACRSVVNSVDNANLILIEIDAVTSSEQLAQVLQEHHISALICDDGTYFNQAMKLLMPLPIHIPQDLSILSLGDTNTSFATTTPVTHVRLLHRRVGEKAGEVLLDLLAGRVEAPQQVLVPCEFIVGDTTALYQPDQIVKWT